MPIPKKTIVVINGRDLAKTVGGTHTYLKNLLLNLDKLLTKDKTLKVFVQIPDLVEDIHFQNIHLIRSKTSHPFFFDLCILGFNAIRVKADIVIGTKYAVPPLLGKKNFSLIYDLGYFYKEPYYPWREKIKMRLLILLGRLYTSKYLTISKTVKKDIQKYLKVDSNQVTILYPGADHLINISSQPITNPKLPAKYILYVGSSSPRKNLSTLLKVMATNDNLLPLVITGYFDNNAKREIKNFKQVNIFHLSKVDETNLVYLYQHAHIFVYTSLFEGFGIPIIEAQNMKVPVITSNVSSMPEVAGKGALFVNPNSHTEIENAIKKLTQNTLARKELKKKGFKNSQKFTWTKTAQQLLTIIKQN